MKNSSDKRSNYSKPKQRTENKPFQPARKPKDKSHGEKTRQKKVEPKQEETIVIEPLEEGQDFLYGRNPVLEALRTGREMNKLFIQEGQQKGPLAVIHAMAKEAGVQTQIVPRSKLHGLTGSGKSPGCRGCRRGIRVCGTRRYFCTGRKERRDTVDDFTR